MPVEWPMSFNSETTMRNARQEDILEWGIRGRLDQRAI